MLLNTPLEDGSLELHSEDAMHFKDFQENPHVLSYYLVTILADSLFLTTNGLIHLIQVCARGNREETVVPKYKHKNILESINFFPLLRCKKNISFKFTFDFIEIKDWNPLNVTLNHSSCFM